MKREMHEESRRLLDEIDLRQAFRDEPDACHAALMDAARSVKEEPKVKRFSFRAALIAAIIIVAMTAVALAAATRANLNDWFETYYGTPIPQAARDMLAGMERKTHEVGPFTFTVQEKLVDGRVAYLTVNAAMTDGSPVVLISNALDPYDRVGEAFAAQMNHPQINAKTTAVDAAKIAGIPMYCVDAWFQPKNDVMAGEEMMDCMRQADGSALLVDMLYMDPSKVGDVFETDIVMRAYELDLDTLEKKEGQEWKSVETQSLPVSGVIAEKTYLPEGQMKLNGIYTVTKVIAEQTCAGVYFSICADVKPGMTLADLPMEHLRIVDAQGNRFPTGISLTGELLDGEGNKFSWEIPAEEVPVTSVRFRSMASLDALPETVIVTDGHVVVAK